MGPCERPSSRCSSKLDGPLISGVSRRMPPENLTPANSDDGYVTEASRAVRSVESRAVKTIREIFESGRPLTYIRSTEEKRVTRVLCEVGSALSASRPAPVWTWSSTEGMNREGQPSESGTQ